MRILKFAKTDFILSKKMLWTLLFPVFTFLILLKMDGESSIPAFCYCLFAGIILCTVPLSEGSGAENGFLKLLPCKKEEQTKGHFLFALLILLFFSVLALAAIGAARLIRPAISFAPAALYLVLVGVALQFSAAELLILSIFHSDSAHAMQILRIAPAFLFWFGGMFLQDLLPDLAARFLTWNPRLTGLIFFALCLLLYALLAHLCSILVSRQDAV